MLTSPQLHVFPKLAKLAKREFVRFTKCYDNDDAYDNAYEDLSDRFHERCNVKQIKRDRFGSGKTSGGRLLFKQVDRKDFHESRKANGELAFSEAERCRFEDYCKVMSPDDCDHHEAYWESLLEELWLEYEFCLAMEMPAVHPDHEMAIYLKEDMFATKVLH